MVYLTVSTTVPLIAASGTDELRLLFFTSLTFGQLFVQEIVCCLGLGGRLLVWVEPMVVAVLVYYQSIDAVVRLVILVI